MNEISPDSIPSSDSRTQPRSVLAYDLLWQQITEGKLKPGDHILEHDLAQKLNLSRTPVREAIKLLQAEGLLEPSGGRGLIVTTLSIEQVAQLFEMREAVEGLAARLAARHANADEISQMSALLAEEAKTSEAEFTKLLNINDKFHSTIHRASNNQYVLQNMRKYSSTMVLLRQMTREKFSPSPNAHDHHLAIFDAIEREDPVKAEETMRRHIRFSRRKRIALLERYFES